MVFLLVLLVVFQWGSVEKKKKNCLNGNTTYGKWNCSLKVQFYKNQLYDAVDSVIIVKNDMDFNNLQ